MKTVKIPELEEITQKYRSKGFFTAEMDDIIRAYYYRVPSKDIARVLNEKFGTNFSFSQIQSRASKLGIRRD